MDDAGGSEPRSVDRSTDRRPSDDGGTTSPDHPPDGGADHAGQPPDAGQPPADSARPADPPRLSPRRALGLALGFAVLGPAVGVGVLLAVGGLIRAIGAEPSTFEAVLLSLVFVTGIGFGGVALAYGRVVPGLLRASVPDLRDLAATVVGYGLTFAAVFAGGVAAMAFRTATGIEPAQNQVAQVGQRDPTVLLLLIPAAFLLIGPGEELLFRGVVQGTLRRAFDPAPAIAIAAAVFAAIHYFALAGPSVGRVATIGVLFLPSLVFGAVYEYTDNLVVPSLIHGAYDATLFAVLYAVIRYGRSIDALSETREAAATLALLQ